MKGEIKVWLKEFEEKEGRPAGNEEKVRLAQRGDVEHFQKITVGATAVLVSPNVYAVAVDLVYKYV